VYNKGFQLEVCTDLGGGQNLSHANAGDYTEYDVFLSHSGLFRIDYRVATQVSGKFELRLVEEDKITTLSSITVSSTGGWQTWKTLSAEVNLKKGKNRLRFYAVSGEFNLNWISATTITVTAVETISAENKMVAVYDQLNKAITIFNSAVNDENCMIECYDMSGRKMFTRRLNVEGNMASLADVSLPNGLYLLRVETKGKDFVQKIRVQ